MCSPTTTTTASDYDGVRSAIAPHEPYCTFVLLAEFDIDRGATLVHQYPHPVPHHPHQVAELMLPDGVHAQTEDWTLFFLPSAADAQRATQRAEDFKALNPSPPLSLCSSSSFEAEHEREEDEPVKPILPPVDPANAEGLTYMLSFVRTKHDPTVRRGAQVKAMCIGTRLPFVHAFKPLLLLALDRYFADPGIHQLQRAYEAINGLDLRSMPVFARAERMVLRGQTRRDLWDERFLRAKRQNQQPSLELLLDGPSASLDDDGTDSFTGGNTNETASLTSSEVQLAGRKKDTRVFSTMVRLNNLPIPIHIPLTTFPQEVGEYSLINLFRTFGWPVAAASSTTAALATSAGAQHVPSEGAGGGTRQPVLGPIHPHLHTNGAATHPLIILFNAIHTNKRVLFLGHGYAARHVKSHVLSAMMLASGCGAVFEGLVAKTFPYINLNHLELLLHAPDGYIAGVTNPRFEELGHWDVLCNLETSRVQVAKHIQPSVASILKAYAAPHSQSQQQKKGRNGSSTQGGEGSLGFGPGPGSVAAALPPPPPPPPPGMPGSVPYSTQTNASVLSHGSRSAHLSRSDSLSAASTRSGFPSDRMSEFGLRHSTIRRPSQSHAQSQSTGSSTLANVLATSGKDGRHGPWAETRSESYDTAYMDSITLAIQSHAGEDFVRQRVLEYALQFVKFVARHELYLYGCTRIEGWGTKVFNPGTNTLGSGILPTLGDEGLNGGKRWTRDPEVVHASAAMGPVDVPDLWGRAMVVEAWRQTRQYERFVAIHQLRVAYSPMTALDAGYQIARLRNVRTTLPVSSAEHQAILAALAANVQKPSEVTHLLAYLPAYHGGLTSLAWGLLSPYEKVRLYTLQIFTQVALHPVGNKLVQSLDLFTKGLLVDGLTAVVHPSPSLPCLDAQPSLEQAPVEPTLGPSNEVPEDEEKARPVRKSLPARTPTHELPASSAPLPHATPSDSGTRSSLGLLDHGTGSSSTLSHPETDRSQGPPSAWNKKFRGSLGVRVGSLTARSPGTDGPSTSGSNELTHEERGNEGHTWRGIVGRKLFFPRH